MQAVAAAIDNIWVNGPIEVGALAAAEEYAPSADGPKADANATPDFIGTADHILATYHKSVSVPIAGACVFLAKCAEARAKCHGADGSWIAAGVRARPADADIAGADDVTISAVKVGVAILLAGKVNYWKCNHHTGGTPFTGYLEKVCRKLDIDTSNKEIASLIWRVCHWADTRVILSAVGVQIPAAIVPAASTLAITNIIHLPEDALIRIASNPAGTAAWSDVWAGIRAVEVHGVVCATGPRMPISRARAVAIADAIASGDPSYHIGAKYLAGVDRKIIPAWSQAVVDWVYTALKFFHSRSSLLNAAVFKTASENPTAIRIYADSANAVKIEDLVARGDIGYSWAEDDDAGAE